MVNNAIFFVLDFKTCAGTVNKVNCFIGQLLITHILYRICNCISNCLISNLNTVMFFIILLKTFKDLNSSCFTWLVNSNTLETAHQCTILFKVLAEFFPGSAGNYFDSTFAQCWFKHISHIIATATAGACATHHMCLVNEQNAVLFLFKCADDHLQAFFKVSAIFATCKHSTDI